jgi:hypothetical protein
VVGGASLEVLLECSGIAVVGELLHDRTSSVLDYKRQDSVDMRFDVKNRGIEVLECREGLMERDPEGCSRRAELVSNVVAPLIT